MASTCLLPSSKKLHICRSASGMLACARDQDCSACFHGASCAGIVRRASGLAEGLPEGATEWDLSGLTLDGQPFDKDTVVQVRGWLETCSSNTLDCRSERQSAEVVCACVFCRHNTTCLHAS
jgi:hypothetical protein